MLSLIQVVFIIKPNKKHLNSKWIQYACKLCIRAQDPHTNALIGRNGWSHMPLEVKINTWLKWLLNTDVHYRRSLILSRMVFFSKVFTCKWSVENYITYHLLLYVTLIILFFEFQYVMILSTKLNLPHILLLVSAWNFF